MRPHSSSRIRVAAVTHRVLTLNNEHLMIRPVRQLIGIVR